MIKVLMIPGPRYHAQQFCNMIKNNRKALYVSADSGNVDGEEPQADNDLLILEMRPDGGPCDYGADIVIAADGAAPADRLPGGCIKKGAMLIFDPGSTDQCALISALDLTPVTCGTGEKNTISVSSVQDNAIVLTVGRDVPNLYGKTIEVQDHIFRGEQHDVRSAVLACALLLLTEEREAI